MKLGFSLQSSYNLPMDGILRLLREVGFAAVSPLWERDGSLAQTVRSAEVHGLTLQSLHAPHRGVTTMWQPEPAVLADLLQAADDCAAFGFPVLVVHVWGGYDYTFPGGDLYFRNFDLLVERAEKNHSQIAFENLEGAEYLDALMGRYRDVAAVGFCWDSGHELCYGPDRDFLKDYGDRLIMTHLNDNFGITAPDGRLQGTDDLHLLPFDGKLDWADTMARLKRAKKQDILNFELKIRPKGDRCKTDLYSALPLETYLRLAFQRATQAAGYYE